MARQSIVAQVEEIVEPIAHRSGLEVADVELLGQGSRTVLRVVVESAGESAPGVTVEELARVSEVLSRQLDLRDLIPHAYTLEVSSPGLDRPLKKDRDSSGSPAGRSRCGRSRRSRTSATSRGACSGWRAA